ncbi:MAG: hypothetical protein ACREMR_04215 [Gemmatimonadales bacterium]
MQRVIGLCGAVVVGLLGVARPAAAQRMSAIEVGLVAPGDGQLLQVGYRYSVLGRNGPGIEIAVATLPEAVVYGVVVLGADFDAAFLLSPTPEVGLVARGGVSTIAGAGGGGGGAVFGYNLGGGVLVRAWSQGALRVDYTHRRFSIDGDRLSLPSLTIGVVWFR